MNEVWKDVPGYENLYKISNCGQVRSFFNNKDKKVDKAKELRNKFFERVDRNNVTSYDWGMWTAKDCALIAVDEIIYVLEHFGYSGVMYDDFENGNKVFNDEKLPDDYWRNVKKEIESL